MASPHDRRTMSSNPIGAEMFPSGLDSALGRDSEPPKIYWLEQVSGMLGGISESYLRSQLRSRKFSGVKIAGRWAMTEAQIVAAIQALTSEARPADAPSAAGLSKHSRLRGRLRARSREPSGPQRAQWKSHGRGSQGDPSPSEDVAKQENR